MILSEAIEKEEAEFLAHKKCLDSLDKNMPTDMKESFNKTIGEQMEYHRQLVEWLKELQKLKEE